VEGAMSRAKIETVVKKRLMDLCAKVERMEKGNLGKVRSISERRKHKIDRQAAEIRELQSNVRKLYQEMHNRNVPLVEEARKVLAEGMEWPADMALAQVRGVVKVALAAGCLTEVQVSDECRAFNKKFAAFVPEWKKKYVQALEAQR